MQQDEVPRAGATESFDGALQCLLGFRRPLTGVSQTCLEGELRTELTMLGALDLEKQAKHQKRENSAARTLVVSQTSSRLSLLASNAFLTSSSLRYARAESTCR